MAVLKTLLATVFFTLSLTNAQTTPNPAEFCTDTTYPGGDTDGIPLGSGYCAAIDPDIGVCQTFAADSPLVNNLTFVYIPPPYIYECNLYTDDACAGTPLTVSYGETDLSNRELSPPGYNDDVESWECFST